MNKEYLPLYEYLDIAKKTIAFFGGQYCPGLVRQMLNSDDVIANVATSIMKADWKWEENRGMTKRSLRNKYARWEIFRYLGVRARTKINPISLESFLVNDYLIDKELTPQKKIIQKERNREVLNKCGEILSERYLQCLVSYYVDGLTYRELGVIHGCSKQRIAKIIKRGLKKIRESESEI